MDIKTFQNVYDLAEFHYYITTNEKDDCINVLELLLNTNQIDDNIEKDLSNIFIVEAVHHSYVFSGYTILECYITDNGMVKIICIK